MYSIHLEKSTAHAVSPVRKTRLLYFDRRCGVWLQNRSWDAAQAGRHALDRQGAIIALRCSKLSGRFQDFWERRSERKQVAA
jgi:hypothetical protein